MSNEEMPKEAEKCSNDCGYHGGTTLTEVSPKVFTPEGLNPYPVGLSEDLKAKLEKLFSSARRPETTEKETIATGTDFKVGEFEDTDIDGLRVTTAIKSDLKAEDIKRIMGAAEKMDCSDEDDDGNPVIGTVDDGGPAKSEYKPGMLRDLKAKFYPNDSAGTDAQSRLDNGESDAEVEVSRVSPEVIAKETAQLNELSKWAEEIESGLPHQFGILECVTLENGTRIYVPKDFDFNKSRSLNGSFPHTVEDDRAVISAKLEKIMKAATVSATNKALEIRRLRTAELRKQIIKQRKAVENAITISAIENPNLIRRAIRTLRRTCKRIVVWWRL